jgi:hypothetical protein
VLSSEGQGCLSSGKPKKLCAAHYLTCGNLGSEKYLFYELLQQRDRSTIAFRRKWHCRNTTVEVDRHCGFSEQGYRAQLGIVRNSQPTPAEMHAVQYLHGSLSGKNELLRALFPSHASILPNEPTCAPSVLCFDRVSGRPMPRDGLIYASTMIWA